MPPFLSLVPPRDSPATGHVSVRPSPPIEIVEGPRIVEYCPFCGEQVLTTAKKCKHCGETLDVALRAAEEAKRLAEHSSRGRATEPSPAWHTVRPLVIIGMLLMMFGGLATLYFLNMDTSVAVPSTELMGQTVGGGRVHNIGLMQERQNGLIVSLAVCALGLVLAIVGRRK